MKSSAGLIVIFFFMTPILTLAAQVYNAGFVSGLWYSKTPFFEGETIRIYTAFQNHSGGDIAGVAEFFDGGTSIGKADFSALNDRLIETWIDWTATSGTHDISVKITDLTRSTPGKPATEIQVTETESKTSEVFVDKDTDKDGVGDKTDPDIDNDGLSNIEEKKIGTDPYSPDTDKDGLADNKDPQPLTPFVPKQDVVVSLPKEQESTPSSPGVFGGGAFSTAVSNVNNYADDLEKKATAARDEIVSRLKAIGEMEKRVDANHDGSVNLFDFNTLMVNWGMKGDNIADYNGDGKVDLVDFNILMVYWV